MEVKEFDYDTGRGFAFIILENGMNVQCCLCLSDDQELPSLGKIVMGDCGYDWGICGDVNEAAFNLYGEEACMEALFDEAKKSSLEVVE